MWPPLNAILATDALEEGETDAKHLGCFCHGKAEMALQGFEGDGVHLEGYCSAHCG